MSKTPEEMAQQYTSTIADTHSVKAACEKAFIAGYEARRNQKQNRKEEWMSGLNHLTANEEFFEGNRKFESCLFRQQIFGL